MKVLYVSMGGRQWKGDSELFPREMASRVRVEIDQYVMDGSTPDDASHFYKNPDYFQKEHGIGAAKDYDVIVYTGHDGSSYEAAQDVAALVKAHNGVLGAKPAMFLRCSHFFAAGYYETYRELLGLGSLSHEPAKPEGTYKFPNSADVCVEGIDTSNQYAPEDVCTNTYYPNGGYYGRSLVALVQVEKTEFIHPIVWKYEYSNNLSGGSTVHPRMFTHTYDMSSGGGDAPFTRVVWDIIARGLIWVAGKDNAAFLR